MKNVLHIGIIIVALCMITGCTTKRKEEKIVEYNYKQLTMKEAKELMNNETDYIILDVRTLEEYNRGHIPNAINVSNENIGTEDIAELPDKEQMILVYCRSGYRSVLASEKLAMLGYTNIIEIGGILDWDGEIEQ